jgi:hypothetical protein
MEHALPARMMFAVSCMDVFEFEEGEEAQGKENLEKMRAYLKDACLEPLNGLPIKIKRTLAKSIDKTHSDVMSEYNEQRADKVATAIYYFLKELTDTGYLELWEGSLVAEAAALYMPMIEHVFDEEKLDASAKKQAFRILDKFQKKGLYI